MVVVVGEMEVRLLLLLEEEDFLCRGSVVVKARRRGLLGGRTERVWHVEQVHGEEILWRGN